MKSQPLFLPLSLAEAKNLGINQFDIILVTGDAYVDHPSFGTALIGRVLWDAGFSVGIIAQPDVQSDKDFTTLGAPRLFFGISSGNVDSMVNAFTPNLKRRNSDAYSPGGVPRRPDRATIVYANRIHQIYPGIPIVLGGIEASLRRFAHYDFWQDRVRQSVLADAPGDLIAYGMAELAMTEIARRLDSGEPAGSLRDIRGTCYKTGLAEWQDIRSDTIVEIPGFSEVSSNKEAYARAFSAHYREQDPVRGRPVAQPHPKTVIVQNPPARPLTTAELDHIYGLPFSRMTHPSYREPVPALEPVQFSVVSHRGCFGSCSFCALTHHQGRIIQSRSIGSVVREVTRMASMPGFKGIVTDVGGPTANMYGVMCECWDSSGTCQGKTCSPACKSLKADHRTYRELLRKIREVPGVKRVFVSSGVRYDLIPADEPGALFLKDLCTHYVSGHLKVAPEHISRPVTSAMNKPNREVFDRFHSRFEELQKGKTRRQYLVPYFMSGHPGCTIGDMVELAEYIRDHRMYTEQVQDFTPTPMTLSTCMYFTGLHPHTMEPVHVPRGREKKVQRALMQFREPDNLDLVTEGLRTAGRDDLIGSGKKCLVTGVQGSGKRTGVMAARGNGRKIGEMGKTTYNRKSK